MSSTEPASKPKIRGLARTGAIVCLVFSALTAAGTFVAGWARPEGAADFSSIIKSIWELGSEEGFFPYTVFGVLTILAVLAAIAFLAAPAPTRSTAAAVLAAIGVLQLCFVLLVAWSIGDQGYEVRGVTWLFVGFVGIAALAAVTTFLYRAPKASA